MVSIKVPIQLKTIMAFDSESFFEEHIRELIGRCIIPLDPNLILFKNKKAVDILLCRNGEEAALYFIEIKYHKFNHGRLGTGHKGGVGFQPEILSTRTTYFENNMRWILGIEGFDCYYFLDNTQLRQYISGGNIDAKYNGIQKKLFKIETSLDEFELVEKLKSWLIKAN